MSKSGLAVKESQHGGLHNSQTQFESVVLRTRHVYSFSQLSAPFTDVNIIK